MAKWVSASQFERDHNGHRNHCASCGHDGTTRDPLVVTTSGGREHSSHVPDSERQR
jgi:hypothetical protein